MVLGSVEVESVGAFPSTMVGPGDMGLSCPSPLPCALAGLLNFSTYLQDPASFSCFTLNDRARHHSRTQPAITKFLISCYRPISKEVSQGRERVQQPCM